MNRTTTPKPKDRFLFVVVYPLLALAAVHMGNDTPWRIALTLPSYYTDIAFALGIAYLVGFYLRKISLKLQHILDWQLHLHKRIFWQMLLGVGVPIAFVFLCEWVYLHQLGISLASSSMFYYELPLSAIFFSFINGLYYFLQTHSVATTIEENDEIAEEANKSATHLETILVTAGFTTKPIATTDIAYFYVLDKAVYLVTTETQKYLLKEPLEEITQKLNPDVFFKLNRWVLAHRQSIRQAEHTSTRKLLIHLEPPLTEDVFVSKERAIRFLTWLEN